MSTHTIRKSSHEGIDYFPRLTILCALLGVVGLACPLRGAETALAEKVKAVGGNLGGFQGGGSSVYFRSASTMTEEVWKLLESIDDLKSFYCNDGTDFGDAQLGRLCKIKSLERIFVNGAAFTDAGFAALATPPTLRYFGAHHSFKFSGAGLAPLKNCKNLVSLEFGGSAFDDDGLRVVCGMPQLQELVVGGTRVTSAGFPNLAKLVNLKKLHLSTGYFPHFTAADFGHLAALQNLEELTIGRMVLPYDGGLSQLKQLKRLKALKMTTCGVTAADLERLKADLPKVAIEWTPAPQQNIESWNQEIERRKAEKAAKPGLHSALNVAGTLTAAEPAPVVACVAPAIETPSIPGEERWSEDYRLTVAGRDVPVYACRVSAVPLNQVWPGYQRPLDQTEMAGFAYWNMHGPAPNSKGLTT